MRKYLRYFVFKATFITFAILYLSSILYGQAGKVTVSWNPIPDPHVGGYTVVWGTTSKTYTGSQDVGAAITELTLTLQGGKTYYFAVRGFDKNNVPGLLSNEVSALVKASDSTPPVISGVSAGNITSSSATISFSTDEDAYVQVAYGTSAALGLYSGLTNVSSKSHQVGVEQPIRFYNVFLSSSRQRSFWEPSSFPVLSFKTQAGSDNPPDPNAAIKFTQITLTNVSSNSVSINWVTDKWTTGFVQYGLDANFGMNASDSNSLTNHLTELIFPDSIHPLPVSNYGDGHRRSPGRFRDSDV